MRVAVFGNNFQEKHLAEVAALFRALASRNLWVEIEAEFYDYLCRVLPEPPEVNDLITAPDFEAAMALSIGGDGTFLQTARRVGPRQIPILGVNTGHLGYLADATATDVMERLDEILAGRFTVEDRTMMQVTADHAPLTAPVYALNEVAVMKLDSSSMIDMHTFIDGDRLGVYKADGLIMATPTGSTGYNLSVGGPVVAPKAPVWVLSPIAAHSLTMRPLVVDNHSVIAVTTSGRGSAYRVSADGCSVSLPFGSTITVRRAPFVTRVLQSPGHRFTDTLRSKLLWGVDSR